MRFDDFVAALRDAGWRPALDARHTEIKRLWETMFPVLADVEEDLSVSEGLLEDCRRERDALKYAAKRNKGVAGYAESV